MMTYMPVGATTMLVALLMTLSGCGGSGQLPELGQVRGTVTLDGQPLSSVEVAFHPVDGRPAFGRTNAAGQYSLQYKPDTSGCKVGKNLVRIGNAEGEGDEPELEGDDLIQKPGQKRPVILERYNVKSELEADVQPGDNTFDFDLKSKP